MDKTIGQPINIAYIDAANLDNGFRFYADWALDYKRFRIWLQEKYRVEKAYIFIGYIKKYQPLYDLLVAAGFELRFKEVVFQSDGKPKGNCDTDLVMQAMEDFYTGALAQAVLVSSDGDYAPLVKKLHDANSFHTLLSPSPERKCSILLKRVGIRITYLATKRRILAKRQN